MPTDEERREAACMVRSAGNQSPRMWQQIRGMLGMPKDRGIPQIREHLASLIEPELERTCKKNEHKTGDPHMRCFSCSECDYGWFEDVNDKPFSY